MKRFSKSKTYIDKDGSTYSYEGKYRGFWQFYKFFDSHSSLNVYSENDVLELKLKEK